MKVSVRGSIIDLLAFSRLPGKRQKRFAQASAAPLALHSVNQLADQLHPARLNLVIAEVRDETPSSRTYRLVPAHESKRSLPCFRAGQYVSVKTRVNGSVITRPYSISSAPVEALGDQGFYEITMRRVEPGLLTEHAWTNWSVGTKVESSGPVGFFYHDPLRDANRMVGLAGGTGITPFRSMAREIVHGSMQVPLVLLYGSNDEDDILFHDELKSLEAAADGGLQVVHVLSCEEVSLPGCEQGFITADMIARHAGRDARSFFVCGPQAMYGFVEGELAKLEVPRRLVRWEVYGERKDITADPNFPADAVGATHSIKVRQVGDCHEVSATSTETVLVAMERAGLVAPSLCRSGECGFCRSLLVAGDVYVAPDTDGRRAADQAHGFIHPCSSYPLSDLELQVPPAA